MKISSSKNPVVSLLRSRPRPRVLALGLLAVALGCDTGLEPGDKVDGDGDGDNVFTDTGGSFGAGGFSDVLGSGGAGTGAVSGVGGDLLGSGGMIPIHLTCPGVDAEAYMGMPVTLPGLIEAENFDPEGYYDATAGNEDGAYRTDVDVDIKALGAGYAISWWEDGEWLEYTVNVPVAGDYVATFVGGSVGTGQAFSLSSCETPLATNIASPEIANWGETGEVSFDVHLDAGVQILRITVDTGYVDFDSLAFELVMADPGTGGSGSGGGDPGAGGSGTGGSGTGGSTATCPLPTTFSWTSSGVLAEPSGNGWNALKDFSVTKYNGKYLVFGTVANGGWNGFFSTFTSFDEWDTAEQHYHAGHVAPTIFYFTPKDIWVLAYQWGFQYKTSKTPDVWSSWSGGNSLMNYNPDPTGGAGVGPIDQTVICDDTNCYLFFNDDAGGTYRASMPIANFPGQFSGAQKIMQESTSLIFEGVQVYSIKGSNQYLMIIENNGTRAFRAWTATSLSGTWTPLAGANTTQSPFAGQANTTWTGTKWTNDISHGDIVRENPSEKMEIDPCHLQFLYQGRNPAISTEYGDLPYRPGLLTLVD